MIDVVTGAGATDDVGLLDGVLDDVLEDPLDVVVAEGDSSLSGSG